MELTDMKAQLNRIENKLNRIAGWVESKLSKQSENQRHQMKQKVKAMSSEARASAYILGSLPFLMLAILMVLNTNYAMMLFTDPRGYTAVAVGVAMLVTGVGVMFRMVRFEP